MKEVLKYVLYLLVAGVMMGSSCRFYPRKQMPSLIENYRKTGKNPFGSFIAYKGLESEFPGYRINEVNKSFDRSWAEMKINRNMVSKYSLYFIITRTLVLTEEDTDAMMQYVRAGNDLFISAGYVDPKLLKALNCTTDRQSEITNEASGRMKDTHVSMYFGNDFRAPKYGYYYFPFSDFISSYDTSVTRVLGVNENNLPNYIILFPGKGRIYLHLAPRAFGNYFLLTGNNYRYFEYVTAYLRFKPQNVYWDEHYKTVAFAHKITAQNDNDNEFSSLSVIRQNSSLLWAFCIGLAALLLFVFFNAKRKQRAIKIIKPETNATVAFTETIGRLYLQQKDNKNIADKMITYFYEYLRRKYFMNTSSFDGIFINTLAKKSGTSLDETNRLFEIIQKLKTQQEVSDEELIELNTGIENFKNDTDGRKRL